MKSAIILDCPNGPFVRLNTAVVAGIELNSQNALNYLYGRNENI